MCIRDSYDNEVSAYVYRENVILTLIGVLAGAVFGIFLHLSLIHICKDGDEPSDYIKVQCKYSGNSKELILKGVPKGNWYIGCLLYTSVRNSRSEYFGNVVSGFCICRHISVLL